MKQKNLYVILFMMAILLLSIPLFAQARINGENVKYGEELIVTVENMEPHTFYVLFRQNPDESWTYIGYVISSVNTSKQFSAKPKEIGQYFVYAYNFGSFKPGNPPSEPDEGQMLDGYLLIEH